MRSFTYILTLAICTGGGLLAQKNVPGYMGKRWNLQYHAYLSPALNPNSSDVKFDGGYIDNTLSVNLQHHITAAFTYSKRIEFLVEYNMANTNFDPYPENTDNLDLSTLYYPGMKARGGAVGIRLYSKHFAPLGSHVGFKVGYTRLSIEDLSYTYTDYDGLKQPTTVNGGTKGAPTLTASFGNNRVIKDRLVLSYGLDLTLYTGVLFNELGLFGVFESLDNTFYPEYGNQDSNQEAYMNTAVVRYTLMSMVNFKLGIGILL